MPVLNKHAHISCLCEYNHDPPLLNGSGESLA